MRQVRLGQTDLRVRPAQPEGTAAAADLDLAAEDLDAIVADAVPMWGPHPEGM
jgi:hypothetical protein